MMDQYLHLAMYVAAAWSGLHFLKLYLLLYSYNTLCVAIITLLRVCLLPSWTLTEVVTRPLIGCGGGELFVILGSFHCPEDCLDAIIGEQCCLLLFERGQGILQQ